MMQIKTIEKVIKTKLNEWLETLPSENKDEVKKSLLVSGGSIASMFLGEDVNDFDIYIQDRDVLLRLVKYYTSGLNISVLDGRRKDEYISNFDDFKTGEGVEEEDMGHQLMRAVGNLKENQIRLFVKNMAEGLKVPHNELTKEQMNERYLAAFISPNAISLHNKIQIVNRFHGTPEEIHKTFDFIHATNYFTFKEGLVTNIKALESLLTRHLLYQGSLYPVTSIIRAKKFILRKWHINAGEYLKIMFQISQLDLSNVDTLEDQLIGVDVAYFGTLITALRNAPKGTEITSTYIGVIIDRIFNGAEDSEQL
jgi:hypothetical protein